MFRAAIISLLYAVIFLNRPPSYDDSAGSDVDGEVDFLPEYQHCLSCISPSQYRLGSHAMSEVGGAPDYRAGGSEVSVPVSMPRNR
jgi:hypothetical protein